MISPLPSRVHYHPPWSLLYFLPKQNVPDYTPIGHTLAPIWRLLSVCGGDSSGKRTADKRLLFCKQPSDLLRLGLAPFQMGLFCVGPELKPPRDWFPRGGWFNAITVRSALCRVVTPELSEPGGGAHASRSRGEGGRIRRWDLSWRKDALLSLAKHADASMNDPFMPPPQTGCCLWEGNNLMVQRCFSSHVNHRFIF